MRENITFGADNPPLSRGAVLCTIGCLAALLASTVVQSNHGLHLRNGHEPPSTMKALLNPV